MYPPPSGEDHETGHEHAQARERTRIFTCGRIRALSGRALSPLQLQPAALQLQQPRKLEIPQKLCTEPQNRTPKGPANRRVRTGPLEGAAPLAWPYPWTPERKIPRGLEKFQGAGDPTRQKKQRPREGEQGPRGLCALRALVGHEELQFVPLEAQPRASC